VKESALEVPVFRQDGTIFEDSHVLLSMGLRAMETLANGKNWSRSREIHRTQGITPKSVCLVLHRM
jgi:hypothetical protein